MVTSPSSSEIHGKNPRESITGKGRLIPRIRFLRRTQRLVIVCSRGELEGDILSPRLEDLKALVRNLFLNPA
jgi:hypothetical protein